MNIKKITIGLAIALVALTGFVLGGGRIVIRETAERLGALAGPDIASPFLKWGGLETWRGSMALNTATTTPCAIQAPSATSTLDFSSLTIQTASSTATTWTVAKATTAFATTTPLRNNISLGSGAQGTMLHIASTTAVAIDSVDVFGPNEWLVWSVAGTAVADTTKLNGICKASFHVTGR